MKHVWRILLAAVWAAAAAGCGGRPAGEAATVANARLISTSRCQWPDVESLRQTRPDLDAFLFWSRTPFAEAAPDGSVLIRDARFYDPRGRDRFTVALPDVPCAAVAPN